jgi:hypothetical protein
MTKAYPLEAVIKFAGEMDVNEHEEVWTKYVRNMRRRGIVGMWVREPSRSNRIHYHMILAAPEAEAEAERTILESCPEEYQARLRKPHVKPIYDQHAICGYVCKAKAKGYDERGRYSLDKWENKRLLFAKRIKLKKYGTIGRFWCKPKEAIWREVIERERGIGLHESEVYQAARHLHGLVGDDVPRRHILRSLAYAAWENAKQQIPNDEGELM